MTNASASSMSAACAKQVAVTSHNSPLVSFPPFKKDFCNDHSFVVNTLQTEHCHRALCVLSYSLLPHCPTQKPAVMLYTDIAHHSAIRSAASLIFNSGRLDIPAHCASLAMQEAYIHKFVTQATGSAQKTAMAFGGR